MKTECIAIEVGRKRAPLTSIKRRGDGDHQMFAGFLPGRTVLMQEWRQFYGPGSGFRLSSGLFVYEENNIFSDEDETRDVNRCSGDASKCLIKHQQWHFEQIFIVFQDPSLACFVCGRGASRACSKVHALPLGVFYWISCIPLKMFLRETIKLDRLLFDTTPVQSQQATTTLNWISWIGWWMEGNPGTSEGHRQVMAFHYRLNDARSLETFLAYVHKLVGL